MEKDGNQSETGEAIYNKVIEKTTEDIKECEWQLKMIKMLQTAAEMVQKEVGTENEAVCDARVKIAKMHKETETEIAFRNKFLETSSLGKELLEKLNRE